MASTEGASSDTSPARTDDFVALAQATPGLVERVRTGSPDALVEFFELAPGAEVVATESRELTR